MKKNFKYRTGLTLTRALYDRADYQPSLVGRITSETLLDISQTMDRELEKEQIDAFARLFSDYDTSYDLPMNSLAETQKKTGIALIETIYGNGHSLTADHIKELHPELRAALAQKVKPL